MFEFTFPLRGMTCMAVVVVGLRKFEFTFPLRGMTEPLGLRRGIPKFEFTFPLRGMTLDEKQFYETVSV